MGSSGTSGMTSKVMESSTNAERSSAQVMRVINSCRDSRAARIAVMATAAAPATAISASTAMAPRL